MPGSTHLGLEENAADERTPMTEHPVKSDFPVGQVRRFLEPGPIVLVSSRWEGETNIMTLGWHTIMEFTPSLVECRELGGAQVVSVPGGLITDTPQPTRAGSGRTERPCSRRKAANTGKTDSTSAPTK